MNTLTLIGIIAIFFILASLLLYGLLKSEVNFARQWICDDIYKLHDRIIDDLSRDLRNDIRWEIQESLRRYERGDNLPNKRD
jgi:hypothetical protein